MDDGIGTILSKVVVWTLVVIAALLALGGPAWRGSGYAEVSDGVVLDGQEGLVLVSAAWCGHCHQVEKYLNDAGLTYAKLDADQDRALVEALHGPATLPVLYRYWRDDDGIIRRALLTGDNGRERTLEFLSDEASTPPASTQSSSAASNRRRARRK